MIVNYYTRLSCDAYEIIKIERRQNVINATIIYKGDWCVIAAGPSRIRSSDDYHYDSGGWRHCGGFVVRSGCSGVGGHRRRRGGRYCTVVVRRGRREIVASVNRPRGRVHVIAVGSRRTASVVGHVKVVVGRDLHGRHHFRLEAAVLDVNDFGARRFDRRRRVTRGDPAGPRLPAAETAVMGVMVLVVLMVVVAVLRIRLSGLLLHRRLDVIRPRHRILRRPHGLAGFERRRRRLVFRRGRLVLIVFYADNVVGALVVRRRRRRILLRGGMLRRRELVAAARLQQSAAVIMVQLVLFRDSAVIVVVVIKLIAITVL